jgi:FlaG protein
MSDKPELRVNPTAPAGATEPLHNAGGLPGLPVVPSHPSPPARRREHHDEPVASTAGQLRPAYTEFVVDPTTHEVSVQIRDAATNQVIDQIPSAEVVALNKSLREYADALARRHAAEQGKAVS